jgi:hypothetical protein
MNNHKMKYTIYIDFINSLKIDKVIFLVLKSEYQTQNNLMNFNKNLILDISKNNKNIMIA